MRASVDLSRVASLKRRKKGREKGAKEKRRRGEAKSAARGRRRRSISAGSVCRTIALQEQENKKANQPPVSLFCFFLMNEIARFSPSTP